MKAKWSAKTDIRYTVRHFIEKTDSGINPESDSADSAVVSMKDGTGKERSYYRYGLVVYEDGISDSVQTLNDRLMDCDPHENERTFHQRVYTGGFQQI